MSEHDEPKTALTRLLVEHEVGKGACQRRDLSSGTYYAVCSCGERIPFRDWSPTTFYAHLADVLLAEGYTTTPAPEAVETVEWGAWSEKAQRVMHLHTGSESGARPFLDHLRHTSHPWALSPELQRRTRTSYADTVTEWVPVDRGADGHEEGER